MTKSLPGFWRFDGIERRLRSGLPMTDVEVLFLGRPRLVCTVG